MLTTPAPSPPFAPFSPRPDAQLLSLFSDPTLSLQTIADKLGTTLEPLTLWLARPDAQAHLATLESAAAHRVRIVAALQLPSAIRTLHNITEQFNAKVESQSLPADEEHRHRITESARKAATILVRLARFNPLTVGGGRGVCERPPDTTHTLKLHNDSVPFPPSRAEAHAASSAQPARSSIRASIPRTEDSGPRTQDLPSPTLSPANIADLITRALTAQGSPASRVAPLLALLDDHATLNSAQLPTDPAELANAFTQLAPEPLTTTSAPHPVISGSTAHISRTFSSARGQSSLQLKLARRNNSNHPNAWLITSIRHRPPD